MKRLKAAASDPQSHLERFLGGQFWDDCWSYPAFASNMAWAKAGFPATGFGQELRSTQKRRPHTWKNALRLQEIGSSALALCKQEIRSSLHLRPKVQSIACRSFAKGMFSDS